MQSQDWPSPDSLAIRAEVFAGEYFDDMRFTTDRWEPSIVEPYLLVECNGIQEVYSSPELDITRYKFTVGELCEGGEGQCDRKNMTITMAPKCEHDDNVLLHEMIHGYEHLIDECAAYSQFHDVVLLCLYNHLKPQISDLDERILSHAHIFNGIDITHRGGKHDVLFLLKSYDLDLRRGQPLGTVCGYGRDAQGTSSEDAPQA